MKKYEFGIEELIVLREAMAEYKHLVKPPAGASERRERIYRMACALLDQFRGDIVLYKGD